MRNINPALLDIDLQLFEGAAAGAPAGGEGGQQGNAGASAKAEAKKPGSSRREKTGAYDNVVFGRQEDAPAAVDTASPAAEGKAQAESRTTSDTLEARRQAYRDFVDNPENKDIHTEEIQRIINRRFKETKGMEQSLAAQKPIMELLMQRYGIADGDMGKLQNAIEEDSSYWEEAAEQAGLTVEQYKAMQKLERENAELKRMRQRQVGEQMAQQKLAQWTREADQVKALYPSFDLRTELADRDFQGLLKSGVSVQQAYELKHMEEIKAATAKAAAQTAGEQMTARIKSKASRPMENGMSSQSAAIVKSDVHNLSRADRAEAARRAIKGERIKW